jgi:hypothetical protein
MQDFELDFEWPVGTYAIQPPQPIDLGLLAALGPRFSKTALVSVSVPKFRRPTLAQLDWAARLLAASTPTTLESSVLEIAGKLGMLWRKSNIDDSEEIDGSPWWPLWQRLQQIFLMTKRSPKSVEIGEMGLFLTRSRGGDLRLQYKPKHLADALIFVAAKQVTSGSSLRICDFCGGPFPAGGERSRGTRRADSRFCRPKCHTDFHNAAAKAARGKRARRK